MKISAIILLLLIPTITAAQDYRGMSEEDMQQHMQKMQEMQSCMQNIDQKKLKVLEQRSHEMEAEIRSLCATGRRDKAEKKAISFGKKMAKDPTMQAMIKCSEGMKEMMPNMPFMGQDKDSSDQHVCDNSKI